MELEGTIRCGDIRHRPMYVLTATQLKVKQDIEKEEFEKFLVAITPEGCLRVFDEDEVEQVGAKDVSRE